MYWQEFGEAAPELAALGRERFERNRLGLLGTLRRDGYPRMSPLEVLIVGGHVMLGMMWRSRKAHDLLRDPRCMLQNAVADPNAVEGEFKLWGRAVDVQDEAVRARFADASEALGWRPPEPYHLFALDIQQAAFVRIEGSEQLLMRWRAGGAVDTARRRWTGSGFAD